MIDLKEIFLRESLDISFRSECVGAYSGQSDMRIDAMLGDVRIGYLSYSIYEGEVAIQFVKVLPQYRQQGVARQMFEHLMKTEGVVWDDIKHGGQTEDGSEMYEKLNNRFHDPDFKGKKLRLNLTWSEIREIVWELMDKVDPNIEYDMDWANDLGSTIGDIRYNGSGDHESVIEFLLQQPEIQNKLKERK